MGAPPSGTHPVGQGQGDGGGVRTEPESDSKPPKVLFAGNLDVTWLRVCDIAPDGRFLMIRAGQDTDGFPLGDHGGAPAFWISSAR
jgi:hypothetical protein